MLTPDQINQAKATANPSAVATTPGGPAGMTPEQASAWISGTPIPAATPAAPGYFDRVASDISANIDDATKKLTSMPAKPTLRDEVGAGLNLAKNATGGAVAPIAEAPGFKQLGQLFGWAGKNVSDVLMKNPAYADAAKKAADFFDKNPEVGDALATANNVLQLEGGGEAVDGAISATKAAIERTVPTKVGIDAVAEAVKPAPGAPGSPEATAAAAQHASAHDAIDTEVRGLAAKYPSVGKVLNQAEVVSKSDPISVLSSYASGKALPTIAKGKLQVDNATSFLNSQIARLSATKSKLVQTATEVTPIKEFQTRADAIIDAKDGWSLAKKAAMKAEARKITDPWAGTYPDGIPNKELDALKTEETGHSTSYKKGIQSPFNPDAHAIVGQTARQLVQANAKDAPIDELNKVIQSHYDAIKLLNTMRGKAPHGGALSKLMNNTLGEVAGLAGGLAVGHPFIGAMVGRAGAEAINEVINNHFISNPLKRSIVNSMKDADPVVVQKALDYLDQQSGAQPGDNVSAPMDESKDAGEPDKGSHN